VTIYSSMAASSAYTAGSAASCYVATASAHPFSAISAFTSYRLSPRVGVMVRVQSDATHVVMAWRGMCKSAGERRSAGA